MVARELELVIGYNIKFRQSVECPISFGSGIANVLLSTSQSKRTSYGISGKVKFTTKIENE
jgi:hypothetical protein